MIRSTFISFGLHSFLLTLAYFGLPALKTKEPIEVNAKDLIEEEIKKCQANYDTENYGNITRKQFNAFCVCYVNNLADLIETKPNYISYSKPTDEFLEEAEKIIEACYEKVI